MHINGDGFTARRGEVLLDAALLNGIDMPHDCRSGVCGTCKVRVMDGLVIGGECEDAGMVKACQARVITDLEILVEPVPEVLKTKGTVTNLTQLSHDVMEVEIRPSKVISYLPGQYYRFQFRGFPPRYFSPTAPMDRPFDGRSLRLHVRRIPNGRVSPALGREIRPGHPVTLHGPFGSAYFRPELRNRLVLIGSGTGFAPIWSIAEAALAENPRRPIAVIAAAKRLSSLYMAPAFRRLKDYPNVHLIPTVSERPASAARIVRIGRATEHMPQLTPHDIVYACGAPQMVDAVKEIAVAAGATFYADPFTPQHGGANEENNIVQRAIAWLSVLSLPGGWGASGEQQRLLLAKPQDAGREAGPAPRQPHLALPSAFRPNRDGNAGAVRHRQPPQMSGHYSGATAE